MTSPYSAARWHAPLATTAIWGLAAAMAVYWGLRLAAPVDAVAAAAAMTRPSVAADTAAVGRLLGVVAVSSTAPAAPEAASRFALAGVVADPSKQGAALIAIDGKPPRPFRVGSRVGEGYVLQAVGLRSATLGTSADAPAAFTLQLPVRAPIGTGVHGASSQAFQRPVGPNGMGMPPAVMAPPGMPPMSAPQ